jgi:hypothetical protein
MQNLSLGLLEILVKLLHLLFNLTLILKTDGVRFTMSSLKIIHWTGERVETEC